MYNLAVFAALLAICFGVASLGASVTLPEIGGWYRTLDKPAWTPPNRLFGPVWSVLYFCMAVAAWRVWMKLGLAGAGRELGLFFIQLGLNLLWSCLFFQLHATRAALADVGMLWVLILLTMVAFYHVDALAGLLFVPYLAWVTFASALNLEICRREVQGMGGRVDRGVFGS